MIDHWSASRFMAWDTCPVFFKDRYVDGLAQPKSEAMLFGSAVHLGLAYQFMDGGGDDAADRVLKIALREYSLRPEYLAVGLTLLDEVRKLGLKGHPELPFTLKTDLWWGANTIGFIDLVDPDLGIVYDFKTTIGNWGQERADRDVWQPTLYRWGAQEVFDYPSDDESFRFQYVVLNRRTLSVDVLEPQRNWANDWNQCMTAGTFIAKMVGDNAFPCIGSHGKCLECGEVWDHGHVCDLSVLPPRIHLGRAS
jgi:PD-(D/E)XK nuclease superfamily